MDGNQVSLAPGAQFTIRLPGPFAPGFLDGLTGRLTSIATSDGSEALARIVSAEIDGDGAAITYEVIARP